MSRLFRLKGAPNEVGELQRAATDPRLEVRLYVGDVIVEWLAKVDPEAALQIQRTLVSFKPVR